MRPDPLTAGQVPPDVLQLCDTVRVLVGPRRGEEVVVTEVRGGRYEVACDEQRLYERSELCWLWSDRA